MSCQGRRQSIIPFRAYRTRSDDYRGIQDSSGIYDFSATSLSARFQKFSAVTVRMSAVLVKDLYEEHLPPNLPSASSAKADFVPTLAVGTR